MRMSHGTIKRMCKQAQASRDGLMNAATNATKCEKTSLLKDIYVSTLSMFSTMSKRTCPRPAVNEVLLALFEANKFIGKFLC